jgi:hypothetical protein
VLVEADGRQGPCLLRRALLVGGVQSQKVNARVRQRSRESSAVETRCPQFSIAGIRRTVSARRHNPKGGRFVGLIGLLVVIILVILLLRLL